MYIATRRAHLEAREAGFLVINNYDRIIIVLPSSIASMQNRLRATQ